MNKNIRKIRGQGALEYILIVFVLVGFIVLFGKGLKGRIGGLVNSVFDTVDKNAASLSAGEK